MAKWLIASGFREWGRSRMNVLNGVKIVEGEEADVGVNVGQPIVINGDFVAYSLL